VEIFMFRGYQSYLKQPKLRQAKRYHGEMLTARSPVLFRRLESGPLPKQGRRTQLFDLKQYAFGLLAERFTVRAPLPSQEKYFAFPEKPCWGNVSAVGVEERCQLRRNLLIIGRFDQWTTCLDADPPIAEAPTRCSLPAQSFFRLKALACIFHSLGLVPVCLWNARVRSCCLEYPSSWAISFTERLVARNNSFARFILNRINMPCGEIPKILRNRCRSESCRGFNPKSIGPVTAGRRDD
jgi:hypothetical protein